MKRKCSICNYELTGLYTDVSKQVVYYPCKQCKSVLLLHCQATDKSHGRFVTKTPNFDQVSAKGINCMSPLIKAGIILDICEEEKLCVNNWLDIGSSSEMITENVQSFVRKKEISMLHLNSESALCDKSKTQTIGNADIISCMDILNRIDNPREMIRIGVSQ